MEKNFELYKDIDLRTKGELYIGVVGPVRTGKSTFVRNFIHQMALPYPIDKEIMNDELPISGSGTLITTVEPKFVPKEAVELQIDEQTKVKIRMIDCVGFIIPGVEGIYENQKERMVKTPWFKDEIPFAKAAEIGTEKVINNHSTIGIVLTTDGSFGNISREQYIEAEEHAVEELKSIGKPFIVIINTTKPYDIRTIQLKEQLEDKYKITCLAVNCDQINQNDIQNILKSILFEFPITCVQFYIPAWVNILEKDHPLKTALIENIKKYMNQIYKIKDVDLYKDVLTNNYLDRFYIDEINLASGEAKIQMKVNNLYYYELLSKIMNMEIDNEYEMLAEIDRLSKQKNEFKKVADAMAEVNRKGYGSVMPKREDIQLQEPVLVKHGTKYGVNIKATAPSIHMISADIETEIAPIIGTQQQAQDLIDYIKANNTKENNHLWDTLIFGKTVGELVDEGVSTKIKKMDQDCQEQLQDTLKKIINNSRGNVIFVII